jgi:hypothetical protein
MKNTNNKVSEERDKIITEFLNFNYKRYKRKNKKDKVTKKLKTCMRIIQKECDLKTYLPIDEEKKVRNELSFKYLILIDIMSRSKSYLIK